MAVVLVWLSTVLPWWNFYYSSYLQSAWSVNGSCSGTACGGAQADPGVEGVFLPSYASLLMALVPSLGAPILLLLPASRPRFGRVALIVGAVAALAVLTAPIYVFASLSVAKAGSAPFVAGFFGTYTDTNPHGTFTYSWSGCAGWYLALVACLVLLIATLLQYRLLPRNTKSLIDTPSEKGEPRNDSSG